MKIQSQGRFFYVELPNGQILAKYDYDELLMNINKMGFDIDKDKTVTLTVEEHQFLVEELGENRNRSQELLDDEIISIKNRILVEELAENRKSNIEGYKREVRLFDSILKKL
jgi:hypothetical protein